MSVLQCDRGDCPNIMCNRLSDTHGYICNDCFSELVALGVRTDVHEFMASHVDRADPIATHEYFATLFPETDR